MDKQALLAMHNLMLETVLEDILKDSGYQIIKAKTDYEMLERMGIPLNSLPNTPPTIHFSVYLMDVNLGYYGAPTSEPAQKVYSHVKDLVENGKVKFLAISGTDEAVESAKKLGIPAALKSSSMNSDLNNFLQKL